jgi:hypothetical protein
LLTVGTPATATYSLISMSHATSTTISSWTSGAACLVLGISLIAVEAGRESPMLPLPLLRWRTLGPVAENIDLTAKLLLLDSDFMRWLVANCYALLAKPSRNGS